jgi:trans-aconitate 2-methyltransferase
MIDLQSSSASCDASSREWNAAAYHVVSDPQFAWGLRVLDRVQLAGDEDALDAGCGSGRLTKELASRIPAGSVFACDLSLNMARAAAHTLGGVRTTPVVCADLVSLPFSSRAFDLIFSTATFHWIQDHDRLFAELRAALRDGGRMEAQCGGGPNLAVIHARAGALAAEPIFQACFSAWREPWRFATPEDTERRLLRAGFRNAHCWLEHAPTRFPDADRFRSFVEAVVLRPYLAKLSTADLRKRFVDALVAQAKEDDPSFTLDYWRLNISAATV